MASGKNSMSMGAKLGFYCSTVYIYTPCCAQENQRLADPKSLEDVSFTEGVTNKDLGRGMNQSTRGPSEGASQPPVCQSLGSQSIGRKKVESSMSIQDKPITPRAYGSAGVGARFGLASIPSRDT